MDIDQCQTLKSSRKVTEVSESLATVRIKLPTEVDYFLYLFDRVVACSCKVYRTCLCITSLNKLEVVGLLGQAREAGFINRNLEVVK